MAGRMADTPHLNTEVIDPAADLTAEAAQAFEQVADHGAHHAAEAHSAGLPHLDPEWFASQIFWLIATCAVLYFFMATIIVPRIRDVIENRASRISHDLDRAEQFRSEADAARATFERDLKQSKDKAHTLIEEAQASVKAKVAKAHAEQDKKLAEQFAKAEKKIDKSVSDANAQLAPVIGDVVQTIVKTLTNREADDARVAKLVSEKLAG